jgi:hypothetical protein
VPGPAATVGAPRRDRGADPTPPLWSPLAGPGADPTARFDPITGSPIRRNRHLPELLPEGLPEKAARSKFDFADWADGRAWRFVKGNDYDSSTESFRANVKRWAKVNGYEVELRSYPALDRNGREVPLAKSDAIALGVRFLPADDQTASGSVQ